MTDVSSSDLPIDQPAEAPALDPDFVALVERLMPVLNEVAKAAVTEAAAATPTPTMRPGTVNGVNATDRTVSVVVDGDTDAIQAQSIIDLPSVSDRVMVAFWPPSAVFVVGNQSANSVPPGTLAPYGGTISAHAGAASSSATVGQPPRGWLWCAGQAVSRATYAALFAAIGTTFGSGDGSTTFNVPDFRGRVFIGLDNMGGSDAGRIAASNTLGGTGGTTSLIAHTHDLGNHTHGAGTYAVASHTHDLGNHTHSGSGLSVSSHTHDLGNHTHTVNSHSHSSPGGGFFAEFGAGNDLGAGAATGTQIVGSSSSTGGASPGTGGPSTNTSGSASPGVSGNTGTPSSNTSGSAAPSLSGSSATPSTNTSGSFGSGTEQLPPYVLVHIIIKC